MSIFKINIILVLIVFMSGSFNLNAQRNAPKAKERMEIAKKMRLLEVLNLKDEEADKFLVKYTSFEKNIREKNDYFMEANEDLIEYMDNNPNGKELNEKVNTVVNAHRDFNRAVESKFSDMKSVLSEQNYARFVAFELKFMKRIRRIMSEGPQHGRDVDPEDGRGFPKKKKQRNN